MTGTETVKTPAEVGSCRLVLLTVREKGTCRVCGEPVLRVSNAIDDAWIHARRTQGQAVDHQARPSGVKR